MILLLPPPELQEEDQRQSKEKQDADQVEMVIEYPEIERVPTRSATTAMIDGTQRPSRS